MLGLLGCVISWLVAWFAVLLAWLDGWMAMPLISEVLESSAACRPVPEAEEGSVPDLLNFLMSSMSLTACIFRFAPVAMRASCSVTSSYHVTTNQIKNT